jgi:hypothetical protein
MRANIDVSVNCEINVQCLLTKHINNDFRNDSNLPTGYVDYEEEIEMLDINYITINGHEIKLTEEQIIEILKVI